MPAVLDVQDKDELLLQHALHLSLEGVAAAPLPPGKSHGYSHSHSHSYSQSREVVEIADDDDEDEDYRAWQQALALSRICRE